MSPDRKLNSFEKWIYGYSDASSDQRSLYQLDQSRLTKPPPDMKFAIPLRLPATNHKLSHRNRPFYQNTVFASTSLAMVERFLTDYACAPPVWMQGIAVYYTERPQWWDEETMDSFKRFSVRFSTSKVYPLWAQEDTHLVELESNIVALELEVLEKVVGFKMDDSLKRPTWWKSERMGRWGAKFNQRTWKEVRNVMVAKEIPVLHLGLVQADARK
ncbi:hypothetical protein BZA05DRAFT_461974 [Tricharina praecox]|uniref:uncharacterized protein n=1 Tax=Tricharina praecox TaxID=43433 RepID=UPI00221EB5ED|nr:uncharacterized protein BZA05DRAFT_461974 [Tricharina praecox]KAI5842681.1 hypothetical protein BZA05DRAFT_461974 [Tricharina praecox]